MNTSKTNQFEFASDEEKLKFLNQIISFYQDERNEEIGLIAAEEIFDFFVDKLGVEIYKKAIKDVKKIIRDNSEELNMGIDLLQNN